ncbi:hypothetical protein CEXT_794421 [Caerostris extrusa]|uniref:Uncharacterized protein n=1 Tax=Caerostris extrusa TaxID=172846 RepID=A0AAV4Y532_CAEEX|nr:hypothetical protein CEXT_794421 [Caerostris extrusa]
MESRRRRRTKRHMAALSFTPRLHISRNEALTKLSQDTFRCKRGATTRINTPGLIGPCHSRCRTQRVEEKPPETLITLETPGPSAPGIYCPLPTIHHLSSAPGMARPDKTWCINSCRLYTFWKGHRNVSCESFVHAPLREIWRRELDTRPLGSRHLLPSPNYSASEFGTWNGEGPIRPGALIRVVASLFGKGTGICLAKALSTLHCARYGDAR